MTSEPIEVAGFVLEPGEPYDFTLEHPVSKAELPEGVECLSEIKRSRDPNNVLRVLAKVSEPKL